MSEMLKQGIGEGLDQEFKTFKLSGSDVRDRDIVIQRVSARDALDRDKVRFNSNNHWDYVLDGDRLVESKESVRPEDYDEYSDKHKTKHWIKKFQDNYKVLDIDQKEMYWLREAAKIGRHSARFSKLYQEELDDFLKTMKETDDLSDDQLFDQKVGNFVRTEDVSLKTGIHGVGPYKDIQSIIESSVTSISGHTPVKPDQESVRYYVMPWIEIDPCKEFRIFVKNKKLIAISQQHLYESNCRLDNIPESKVCKTIRRWVEIINRYTDDVIVPKIDHLDSFVADVAILENDIPYFIEINPYGFNRASGSSLFHWIIDQHVFINDHNNIYFRFSV